MKAYKSKVNELMEELTDVANKLSNAQEDLENFEPDPDDYEDEYEDMLDDAYGDFMGMHASYILKKCDPIAYRCGLNDYISTMEDFSRDPRYQDTKEWIDELKEQVDSIENEIMVILDEVEDNLSEASKEYEQFTEYSDEIQECIANTIKNAL